jgi:hypothetical protein
MYSCGCYRVCSAHVATLVYGWNIPLHIRHNAYPKKNGPQHFEQQALGEAMQANLSQAAAVEAQSSTASTCPGISTGALRKPCSGTAPIYDGEFADRNPLSLLFEDGGVTGVRECGAHPAVVSWEFSLQVCWWCS